MPSAPPPPTRITFLICGGLTGFALDAGGEIYTRFLEETALGLFVLTSCFVVTRLARCIPTPRRTTRCLSLDPVRLYLHGWTQAPPAISRPARCLPPCPAPPLSDAHPRCFLISSRLGVRRHTVDRSPSSHHTSRAWLPLGPRCASSVRLLLPVSLPVVFFTWLTARTVHGGVCLGPHILARVVGGACVPPSPVLSTYVIRRLAYLDPRVCKPCPGISRIPKST